MDYAEFDEKAFLACFLSEPDKSLGVIETLDEKHFSMPFHRTVYGASKKVFLSSGCLDIIAVQEKLSLGDCDASKLMEIMASMDYTATQEVLAARIYDRWARDAIKKQSQTLAARVDDPSITTPELCEKMEDVKAELSSQKQTVFTPRQMLKSVAIKLDEIRSGKSWGVVTGFKPFDDAMGGCFDRGDTHVISARTGNGKTSFAINMLIHSGLKCYFASTEMDQNQVALKMAANFSGLDSSKLRYKDYLDANWERLRRGMLEIDKLPLVMDVSSSQKASTIRLGAKKAKRTLGGLDIVIVDHLQFLKPEGKTENRAEQLSESSKILKDMAKDLDIANFTLSQLNRGFEDRGAVEPPRQRDLKGSGAIEEDAASVVFLHYPAKYDDPKAPKFSKNLIQLITSKSRHSDSEIFTDIFFEKECSRFRKFEQADQDDFNFSLGRFN